MEQTSSIWCVTIDIHTCYIFLSNYWYAQPRIECYLCKHQATSHMIQLQYKNHEMGCLNVCYIIGCDYA